MTILIYLLLFKIISVYGSSVNSGCLVHDRGLSNFCNQTNIYFYNYMYIIVSFIII